MSLLQNFNIFEKIIKKTKQDFLDKYSNLALKKFKINSLDKALCYVQIDKYYQQFYLLSLISCMIT